MVPVQLQRFPPDLVRSTASHAAQPLWRAHTASMTGAAAASVAVAGVGRRRGEVPSDQVRSLRRGRVADRRAVCAAQSQR
jgi:hypothetical protein